MPRDYATDEVQVGEAVPLRGPEEAQVVSEVERKYTRWRNARQPYEILWFITAAFLRNLQYVAWNSHRGGLETAPSPKRRIRLTINQMKPKIKARNAKFLKTQFVPQVIPASGDREDKLNARYSQKAISYILEKNKAELKYRKAQGWASTASKGFIWLYWDPSKAARIRMTDPFTGQAQIEDLPAAGDIVLEASSPFEVLPSDLGAETIGEQPEFMRVRVRPLDDVRAMAGEDKARRIKADAGPADTFQYQRQIATLSSRAYNVTPFVVPGGGSQAAVGSGDATEDFVIVKEHFIKPSIRHPKGRYRVVAGGVLLQDQDELPYGFWDMDNPYPCVEFADQESTGQFWPATVAEGMIPVQREYNLLRSTLAEHVRAFVKPKVLAPNQTQIPDGAFTSATNEIIRYNWLPGMAEPKVMYPPSLSGDVWRSIDLYKKEFDELTTIYPASQGDKTGTTSGFQVNLLQEAADGVHAPDIRQHELSFQDLCYKIRRLMRLGYTIPRLMSVTGSGTSIPEVIEFSQHSIDEHAEIKVWTTSALSQSPTIRTKQVLELFASGVLGDAADPATQYKALHLLDVGGVGELQEDDRKDEEKARLENMQLWAGAPAEAVPVLPWDNHSVHMAIHTDETKLPAYEQQDPQARQQHMVHIVQHIENINPAAALAVAQKLGIAHLVPGLMPTPPPGAPPGPPPGPQGPPPGPEGAAPPPPPPGPPPGPPPAPPPPA